MVLTVIDVYQGHRPHAASQSDDNEQLRGHAHRLMAELQQLRSIHKQHVMNNHPRNNVSQTTSTCAEIGVSGFLWDRLGPQIIVVAGGQNSKYMWGAF